MQASSNRSRSPRPLPQIDPSSRKFEVICRVRPLQQAESNEDISIGYSSPTITIFNHAKNLSKEYTFHRVFSDTTKQEEFTRAITEEIFLNCSHGKGSLVLSYGVTNSGKTYTILGNAEEPGILPALVGRFEDQMPGEKIFIRAMEIYTDDLYCLRNGERIQIREAWGGYEFIGGCVYEEITKATTRNIIEAFISNRKAAETSANRASSRSHAIFMLQCGEHHLGIADLAGNERFGTNENLQETFSINKNLLVLGKCIHAFRDGERMPYRQSKLTLALMEYFKPNYKIFMITHLNRTGQMFHENVNVLEYAAVSTQVKHINLKKNPSIMKSMRKERPVGGLSERKEKEGGVSEVKSAERRHNKMLLERYKCYIMGVNAQAEEDLDQYFKQEDEKDMKFLQELKATEFVSPTKSKKMWLDKLEAESRIKLRQLFLEELRLEKEEKMRQEQTGMGPSMRKQYHESPVKKVDCSTFMGTSMQKPSISSQPQDILTTPSKIPTNPESESYLKKVMRNPALMIQSGFRMISNFNQMANTMMESFKGIMGKQQEQQLHEQLQPEREELNNQMQRMSNLAIKRQSGMKITIVGEVIAREPKMMHAEEIQFKDQQVEGSPSVPFTLQESTIDRGNHRSSGFGKINQSQNEESVPISTAQFNDPYPIIPHNPHHNIEQSQLLDGLRSDKDLSTNRTSEFDLLQSQDSLKNKGIIPIPEQVENETITKSASRINEVSQYIKDKQNRKVANIHLNNHQYDPKNETGLKSTQETIQNPPPVSSQSKSQHKSVVKVEHSRSVSKTNNQSHSVEKYRKKMIITSSSMEDKENGKGSGIKTRRMRKNAGQEGMKKSKKSKY